MLGAGYPPPWVKVAKVFQRQGLGLDLLVDGRSKSCQHWVVHCKVLKKLGLPRVGGAISGSVPPIVANRGGRFCQVMAESRFRIGTRRKFSDEIRVGSRIPRQSGCDAFTDSAALPARRIGLLPHELTDYDRQRRASNDVVVSRAGKDGQLCHRPHRSV